MLDIWNQSFYVFLGVGAAVSFSTPVSSFASALLFVLFSDDDQTP